MPTAPSGASLTRGSTSPKKITYDGLMKTVTYSKLQRELRAHLDEVCTDHQPLLVKRRGGTPVVLMSLVAFCGFEETLHLLSEPANAERLPESLAQAEAGQLVEHCVREPRKTD
jgi:antitoxin YefM